MGCSFGVLGGGGRGGGCAGAQVTNCVYIVEMLCNEQGCRWKNSWHGVTEIHNACMP